MFLTLRFHACCSVQETGRACGLWCTCFSDQETSCESFRFRISSRLIRVNSVQSKFADYIQVHCNALVAPIWRQAVLGVCGALVPPIWRQAVNSPDPAPQAALHVLFYVQHKFNNFSWVRFLNRPRFTADACLAEFAQFVCVQ